MTNKVWILRVFILAVIWLMFWFIGAYTLDPDFGWHLKTGEFIAQNGLPKTDPFSYTMPGFPWIDHGWLSDFLIAKLYPLIDRAGLSAIYASLALLSIYIVTNLKFFRWMEPHRQTHSTNQTSKRGEHPVPENQTAHIQAPGSLGIGIDIPLILAGSIFLPFSGIRPQITDWLFLAIIIRLASSENIWKKLRWALPILFCLWANLHGGFALGLFILAAIQTVKMIEQKHFRLSEMIVFILSLASTTLNPYGLRIWQEIWLTISDTGLKWAVMEWQPFFAKVKFSYWLLAVLVGVFAARYWKQIPAWKLTIAGILFAAGLSSLRYMPLFTIVAIPVFSESIEKFYQQTRKNKISASNARIFYRILIIAAAGVFAFESILMILYIKDSPIDNFYPVKALGQIKKIGYEGNLFSHYDWGGYLIWKLPEKKVFVDGRMPSWRWIPPDSKQSSWAFKDYKKIMDKADFATLFEKYNIKIVLLRNPDAQGYANPLISRITDLFHLNTKNTSKADLSEKNKLLYKLSRAGWKQIYSDKTGVIYIFNK